MSRLLEFYGGDDPDIRGRSLEKIWAWRDEDLEQVHDFIQWLFPLPEPSQFNPDAPLLTNEDSAAFLADEQLRANLRKSFSRFLTFLGFSAAEDGQVVPGPHFASRVPEVWATPNHNWLRITRVLRCLTLLGLEAEAQALYERLTVLYSSRKFPILANTFQYWTEAVRSLPFHG